MGRVIFDDTNFIGDLERVVNDALNRQPALIVVPTDKEVRTLVRRFGDELEGKSVWYCSFADYINYKWMMTASEATHIYIFRADDAIENCKGNAVVEYMTVKGRKKFKKEEETNEETVSE